MGILENLELLDKSKNYYIRQDDVGDYEIQCKDTNMVAWVDKEGKESYHLSDLYNSGCDYSEINIYELEKLKRFVELLKGEMK